MTRYAIVPAAGRSRRMGQPKLLLPWRESTVLEHLLGVWKQSQVDQIWVVVHPEDLQIAKVARQAGAEVLVPDHPPPEMRDSIQLALAAITLQPSWTQRSVWMLAPADMPTLTPGAINQVLEAHDPAEPMILAPRCSERRGHPVLFPASLAAMVPEIPAEQGLNWLLANFPVREVETSRREVLKDMDTPDEYRSLRDADQG